MMIIRRIVYRLGFRPKYPSVFFSPSHHFKYVAFPVARDSLQEYKKS